MIFKVDYLIIKLRGRLKLTKQTKENTLDNLKRTLILTQKNDQISKKYWYYNRNIINLSNLSSGVYMTLYFGLIVILYIIGNFVNKKIISFNVFFDFILLIPLFVLPHYILKNIPKRINEYFRIKRVEKNKIEVDRLIFNYNENLKLINNYSIVPSHYRNSYAITSIIQHIENLRADNLKEAINLFEHNQQHIQQMNKLRSIQISQNKIFEETKKATQAANDAEFVSWLNLMHR